MVARRYLSLLLVVQLVLLSGLQPLAQAGFIPTETLLSAQASQDGLSQLNEALARDEVRGELLRLGVDPEQVGARLAALTPDEVRQLQQHIDQLPAGAGLLEVIGVVFLVLLILELVGVINIFNKI
jgi:hypothetical protein